MGMTKEEAWRRTKGYLYDALSSGEEADEIIEALEQEQDEVILTKKEYGELVSCEFDNGYAKGFREALEEQQSVLDKIKEEIKDNTYFINETTEKEGVDFESVEKIINKYRTESEV